MFLIALIVSFSGESIAAGSSPPFGGCHFPPLAGQRPGPETGILQVLLNFTIPFLID